MFNFTAKVNVIANPTGNTLAFGTLIINDVIYIDGWKVVKTDKGVFVSVPKHKGTDKEGKETWFSDVRFNEEKAEDAFRGPIAEAAHKAVLDAYNAASRGAGRGTGAAHASRGNPTGARPAAPPAAAGPRPGSRPPAPPQTRGTPRRATDPNPEELF
jgi:DNA-binding cell septation regulator SpoVG